MPASKLMRVRVDGCSKIIASVRPSKVRRERPSPVERLEGDGQVEQAEQLLARVVLVGEVVAAAQGGEAGQRGRIDGVRRAGGGTWSCSCRSFLLGTAGPDGAGRDHANDN